MFFCPAHTTDFVFFFSLKRHPLEVIPTPYQGSNYILLLFFAPDQCLVTQHVVVEFYPWFKFYFPLFLGMVMHDNE